MTGMHAMAGAVSAWQSLRLHPGYIVDWWVAAAEIPLRSDEPFPIRTQREADVAASAWGLLAWEDTLAEDGLAMPFWADAPMPRAVPDPGGACPSRRSCMTGGRGSRG